MITAEFLCYGQMIAISETNWRDLHEKICEADDKNVYAVMKNI